eukprot:244175-Hanusia_phi.AAC.4
MIGARVILDMLQMSQTHASRRFTFSIMMLVIGAWKISGTNQARRPNSCFTAFGGGIGRSGLYETKYCILYLRGGKSDLNDVQETIQDEGKLTTTCKVIITEACERLLLIH